MDMDVAWCLTCSKRTPETRNPYCSEICRDQDSLPLSSTPLANPPHSTISPPYTFPFSGPRHPSFSVKATPARPSITLIRPPLAALALHTTTSTGFNQAKLCSRDRRAFSFPAPQAPALYPLARRAHGSRQSQAVLPRFVTKPKECRGESYGGIVVESGLVIRSTVGDDSPAEPDAVFCSTSGSSDNEGVVPDALPVKAIPTAFVPKKIAYMGHPSSAELNPQPETRYSSLRSRMPASRPLFDPEIRKASQSPVAALVVSTSSSRSREDIISWARAIELRSGGEVSEDEREHRGRSRTRRQEGLSKLEPIAAGSHDEEDGSAGVATTPKGLSSTLAHLSIGGFGLQPIVKALTSATSTPSDPLKPSKPTGSGLQRMPAPAEVSRVAVVASTIPFDPVTQNDAEIPSYFFGGATPTLSTISVSELLDPSALTDINEPVEIFTDDQSYASSSHRRVSAPIKSPAKIHSRASPLSVLPIAAGANALRSMSSYFRSFAPFSFSPAVAPKSKPAETKPSHPASIVKFPVKPVSAIPPQSSPLPVARISSPIETIQTQEIVRSLPMDIIMPIGSQVVNDERMRERQARDLLERAASHRQSRLRSRSGSRARKDRRFSTDYDRFTPSPSSSHHGKAHSRQISLDDAAAEADASGSDNERPRGRSRRGKSINADSIEKSGSRGRGRQLRAA